MIESANNNLNIYKNFSSVDYSSKKNFLAASYPTREVQYYNDEKKAKKKKIHAVAALGATAIATAGIIMGVVSARHSGKNLSKLLDKKALQEGAENLQENAKKITDKVSNFMGNINPVKDDALDRVAATFREKNIPVLKHLDDFCRGTTSFYRGILKKFQRPAYEKAAEVLRKEGVEVMKFDEWFDALHSTTQKVLKDKRVSKGIANKNIIKTMTQSNIADDILIRSDAYKKVASTIQTDKILSKEGQTALESINKTIGTVRGKTRDIVAGSAPTDFITMILSTVGLGTAVATSDTQEERKSIAVNLGIPLLTTLACNSFIGNAKGIAGAKSLIFSLAAGQLASVAAKIVDKTIKKEDKQQKV